jgi:asparagine synthetase B (glutamine-hydrolysing)
MHIGSSRLRIIDLSPEADQPLPNEDNSVWVAYNGELYDETGNTQTPDSAGSSVPFKK